MVKKVLALAFGLLMAAGVSAQWEPVANPTVPQNVIRHWTGTGENRAVIAITWNDSVAGNIGVVWGVRWNGTTLLVRDAMDTIAAYDSRLTITWNGTHTYVNNLTYVDANLGLNVSGVVDDMSGIAWWMYNWLDSNDVAQSSSGVMDDELSDGDFVDWLPMDPETFETAAADIIYTASDPNAAPLPEAATIAASDILYWVGEGSNEAILAVNWADTALAWGYRFDGEKSVGDMMNDIAAADSRFSIEMGDYGLANILYVVAPGDTLRGQEFSYWESMNNGMMDAGMGQPLADGDFEKWAEPAAGVVADIMFIADYSYWMYSYVYPMAISPVVPEEATIAASDILYWVGEGSNEVVMAVNWADTALAWGFRYDGEKNVGDMMNDIAAADPRFSYTLNGGYLDDILFVVAPGDTLRKQAYSYWESKNNGVSDMGMSQTLNNGDFEKWAEPAAGIIVDSFSYEWDSVTYWSYIYVYYMGISPVSVPQTTGIDGAERVAISVYPNPVADMMTVGGVSGEAVLFDMRGSVVARFEANGTETRVDLRALTNGVYMLRVDNSVAKIVVRH